MSLSWYDYYAEAIFLPPENSLEKIVEEYIKTTKDKYKWCKRIKNKEIELIGNCNCILVELKVIDKSLKIGMMIEYDSGRVPCLSNIINCKSCKFYLAKAPNKRCLGTSLISSFIKLVYFGYLGRQILVDIFSAFAKHGDVKVTKIMFRKELNLENFIREEINEVNSLLSNLELAIQVP